MCCSKNLGDCQIFLVLLFKTTGVSILTLKKGVCFIQTFTYCLTFDLCSIGGFSFADFGVVDIHHVGVLCENLEKSLEFYQNLLGI